VLILQEVTAACLTSLRSLSERYPFTHGLVWRAGFGLAILSRLPFERAEILRIGSVGLPSIIARFNVAGHQLTVVGTHPIAPRGPIRLHRRNLQLAQLAKFAQQTPGPLMLLGDLNCSPWSPIFVDLLRVSGLRDSRKGFDLQPTWPASLPEALRIPIDHCLVSSQVTVHRCAAGPRIGSDHLPIIVEFSLAGGF
jgi:endonuclease/exonuclease/phosphatase (EEP) superfamily protein YafD